jgi:hypothetical protein
MGPGRWTSRRPEVLGDVGTGHEHPVISVVTVTPDHEPAGKGEPSAKHAVTTSSEAMSATQSTPARAGSSSSFPPTTRRL